MNLAQFFDNVDELYLTPENARLGLTLAIPGGKEERNGETVEFMLKAARSGVDCYYRDLMSSEWYAYQNRLERFLKKLKPPQFSPAPVPPEAHPSEAWEQAEKTRAFAERFYKMLGTTLAARDRVRSTFGPAVDRTFQENPRDALKVSMAVALLRDAIDNHYDDPQAVELALIAVAVGVDNKMRSLGDEDGGDSRRARWQQTLGKAKQLMEQEFGPNYSWPRGR